MTDIASPGKGAAIMIEQAGGTNVTRLKNTRHGAMIYPANDTVIGRALDRYGEFANGRNRLLEQILGPGDIVVDVGAYIGQQTLMFAKAVGAEGSVIAVEPQRLFFQMLCGNAQLNGYSNVFTTLAGAGEVPGQVTVPTFNLDQTNNYGALALGEFTDGEQVPMLTIDGLDLEMVTLLNIDVEGNEFDVVRGAEETIRGCNPVIYVGNRHDDMGPALIEQLLRLDYNLYWDLPTLFQPDNYFGEAEDVFGGAVVPGMLCLPKILDVAVDGRPVTDPADTWHQGLPVRRV